MTRGAMTSRWGCPRPGVRLAIAVLGAGIASGLLGVLVGQFSRLVEIVAFGFEFSTSPDGVAGARWWRRLLVALVVGAVCGLVWTRLRPQPRGYLPSVRQVGARGVRGRRRLPVVVTLLDGLAQLLVVGSGLSLGREAAPRRFAALLGQGFADRLGLDDDTRRVMIASAGGAGLASVYNVPLAGAAYALEFVIRPDLRTRRGWTTLGIAVAVSAISGATAWLFNHNAPMYRMSPVQLDGQMILWAGLMGYAGLAVGLPLRSALRWARSCTALTARLWWTVPAVTLAVAAIALWQPRIAGNGQVMVQLALSGGPAPAMLATLCVVKALATVLGFRMGATGGLLTPSVAVGATLGATLAGLSGASAPVVGVAAVVGAACVLAETEHHPVFAATFVIGLVQASPPLAAAIILGVTIAWTTRLLTPSGRALIGRSKDSPDANSG